MNRASQSASRWQGGNTYNTLGLRTPKLPLPPVVDGVRRTKILLLGLPRSGKTSILRLIFEGIDAEDCLDLPRTKEITKLNYDTVVPLEVWDCPMSVKIESLGVPLAHFSSIIFVMDIQDHSSNDAIARLVYFASAAQPINPNGPLLNIDVFIHKSDTISDRHYSERVLVETSNNTHLDLSDLSQDYDNSLVSFSLTSVMDHSIRLSFSRAIHRVTSSLSFLEDLLNHFCTNSQANKAFLVDIHTRLHIATDASPVDDLTHALMCDFLHTLSVFGTLYKLAEGAPARLRTLGPSPSTPVHPVPFSPRSPSSTPRAAPVGLPAPATGEPPPPPPLAYPTASTTLSPAATNARRDGSAITYHQLTARLALVAILPRRTWEGRRGLVEYNVVILREGVREIWDVEWENRGVKR